MFTYGKNDTDAGPKWTFDDSRVPGRVFVTHAQQPVCSGELVPNDKLKEADSGMRFEASDDVTLCRITWYEDPHGSALESFEDSLCFAYRKYLESKGRAPAIAIEEEIERRIEE